jgi:hypothetical protein
MNPGRIRRSSRCVTGTSAWRRGEVGEVAEVLDDAVPDEQEAIADKARGAVLMAGVLPRVVHEIEEAPADGATRRHEMFPRHPVQTGKAKG